MPTDNGTVLNRSFRMVATTALSVSLIPVTWWIIGDQSSKGFAPEKLDYMVRAPEAFERPATVAGVIGAAVAVVCLVILGWQYWRGNIDRRGLIVVATAAGLGIFTGGAARTVTAGVIGANIGAGLVFLFALAGLIALTISFRSTQRPHA